MASKILAKAGEIITCEWPHPMYRLKCDAVSGETLKADMVAPIGYIADPAPNQPFQRCPICDLRWVTSMGYICVNGEWRGAGYYVE